MASVSGTTSGLGNTALRGFGGFASGIDRDSLIEQMTMGTTNKINDQKGQITKTEWKAEAFQKISNLLIDMQDKYFSFSSSSNLMDPQFFGKNIITATGNPDFSKYITATGNSKLLDKLSILGVKQLASAATTMSGKKTSNDYINASGLTTDRLNSANSPVESSKLEGMELEFVFTKSDGTTETDAATATFRLPSSYKGENGKTVEIDYTNMTPDEIADHLNKALKSSEVKIRYGGENVALSDMIQFDVDANGHFNIQKQDKYKDAELKLNASSSAMEGLGYTDITGTDGKEKTRVSIDEFNKSITDGGENSKFENASIERQKMFDYLKDKTITVNFGGQSKEIKLLSQDDLTEEQWKAVENGTMSGDEAMNILTDKLNGRLKQAFGVNSDKNNQQNVSVSYDAQNGGFKFNVLDSSQTLTVTTNSLELRETLGLEAGASNKISMSGTLYDNLDKLGITQTFNSKEEFNEYLKNNPLTINGAEIEGITADTTMNELLAEINDNEEAGVTATYMSATNQFVLVADETGKRGKIQLGGIAEDIFGAVKDPSGKVTDGLEEDGKNAQMEVSYGNGITTTIESMTNTFELEGLKITASGTFGYKADGTLESTSGGVTFSAKADTEKVTEAVKKFVEDYNAMIKEINTQVTTKPNSNYGPLTDAQKDEMDETSIKNWENKAKEGLLFNESVMRELSMDMQSIAASILGSGAKAEDLERIGITFSSDYSDGGTLVFDESKFKQAMETEPETVSDIFTGGGDVKQGLSSIIEEKMVKYATRYSYQNGGSYGKLIEEAGSEKVPTSLTNNYIYRELEEMEEKLDTLQARLKTEQDRYISQFAAMEKMISQMNAQSSYLSQLSV